MIEFQSLLGQVGGAAAIGTGVGFIARKAFQLLKYIVALIVGAQAFLLYWLEDNGVITVHQDEIGGAFSEAASAGEGVFALITAFITQFLDLLVAVLPSGAGFVSGLLLGWYVGGK